MKKENFQPDQDSFDIEIEYEILKEKYDLPNFEKLIEDFDIEKISERETAFLAREIRRTINEKITGYIHLFETLINPNSPPMFVFKILKNMSAKEKSKIQEFYQVLSKIQLEVMKLDTIYSEKEEVKFITKTFKLWQEIKLEIHEIFASFEKNFENSTTLRESSYFN